MISKSKFAALTLAICAFYPGSDQANLAQAAESTAETISTFQGETLTSPSIVFTGGKGRCCPQPEACETYENVPGTTEAPLTNEPDYLAEDRSSPFAQSPAGSQASEAAVAPGAYLDLAVPVTQFRFRFDSAFGNNFADRGEYFYAKCGCFRDPSAGALQDLTAKGPALPESGVDYKDYRFYFEYAFRPRASVFIDLPFRSVDPEQNPNRSGFGDLNTGFKYALIADPYQYFTFQLRVYVPTGNPGDGLGTGHASFEPGLLFFQVLEERFIVQAELKDWIPVDGNDGFVSNVVEVGGGLGYILHDNGRFVITPVMEVVGWRFNGGQKSNNKGVFSADGDTIVNAKPGIRFGWKQPGDPIGMQRNSVYLGWAHPLTNERLYRDVLRLEYRFIY